jgi:hypothetical protein
LPGVAQPLGNSAALTDCDLPSKLYVFVLHKIAISDMLGLDDPIELEDEQLAEACSSDESKAGGDIVCLAGCGALHDMSCLVGLEQMQELDISGCKGIDATTVAEVIAENRSLSELIFGGDIYWDDLDKEPFQAIPGPAILEVGMTKADFSNKNLEAGGATIISAW